MGARRQGPESSHSRLKTHYDQVVVAQATLPQEKNPSTAALALKLKTVLELPGTDANTGWYVAGCKRDYMDSTYHMVSLKKKYTSKEDKEVRIFGIEIPVVKVPSVVEHLFALSLYDKNLRDVMFDHFFTNLRVNELHTLLAFKAWEKKQKDAIPAPAECMSFEKVEENEDEDDEEEHIVVDEDEDEEYSDYELGEDEEEEEEEEDDDEEEEDEDFVIDMEEMSTEDLEVASLTRRMK
jgi:hypothetical protein